MPGVSRVLGLPPWQGRSARTFGEDVLRLELGQEEGAEARGALFLLCGFRPGRLAAGISGCVA